MMDHTQHTILCIYTYHIINTVNIMGLFFCHKVIYSWNFLNFNKSLLDEGL